MKQYSLQLTWDQLCCGSYEVDYGYASTLKGAKALINRARKKYGERHPRNFRIYDHWANVDPVTGYVPCVYQED